MLMYIKSKTCSSLWSSWLFSWSCRSYIYLCILL